MPRPTTQQRDTNGNNKSVILRFIDAINREGKSKEVLSRFTSSAALKNKAASYEARYPGFRIYPVDLVAERDLVAVRFFTDFGNQPGARLRFEGIVPDEAGPVRVEAIAICRLAGERVTEFSFESDVLGQAIAADGAQQADTYPTAVTTVTASFPHEPYVGAEEARNANRSLVLRCLDDLNGQEKTPELIQRYVDDPALARRLLSCEAGFPGFTVSGDEIIAEGDRVAVRFHTEQRHTREFMGKAATGKELSLTGIIICRIANGLIVESWLQADTWTLTQELQESPTAVTEPEFSNHRGPSTP